MTRIKVLPYKYFDLQVTLLEKAKQGNCFTQDVREILISYKKVGGTQVSAQEALEIIKATHLKDRVIQDGTDDILDLVTGFCSAEMLIWK